MSPIPECDYRVETEDAGYYFCRHQRIRAMNNVVSKGFCAMCTYYAKPCEFPRPHPDEVSITEQQHLPPLGKRLWNLARSLKDFVADGMTTVSPEEYERRLQICETCQHRYDNFCIQCGCLLTLKVRGRAFQCPLQKWEKTDELVSLDEQSTNPGIEKSD